MRVVTLLCLAAALLPAAWAARAQVIWDMDNITGRRQQAARPSVQAPPDAWPRLDPGATLCRTEADLARLPLYRQGLGGDRPNCTVVRTPTPIQIVKRTGPGRTQVSITGTEGQDGWTDAWLPERAPPAGGRGVSIR